MMFPNKIALVSGAARGLGRDVTLSLCAEGATVFAVSRDENALNSVVAEAQHGAGMVVPVIIDVTEAGFAQIIERRIRESANALDIAINNAGIFGFGSAREMSVDEVRRIFETNFFALYQMMQMEISLMQPEVGGSIINISSNMSEKLNIEGCAAYTASKAAVDALTRVAAKENVRRNITINSINPGPLSTDMTRLPGEDDASRDRRWSEMIPVGRLGDVSESTEAVKWMLSSKSRYLVGSRIVIDGAHSL